MGFNWNDSPVKKVADDIRDNSEAPLLNRAKNTSTQAAKGRNHRRTLTDTSFATKGKKTENGIVVNVPMEDYMQLTMMKFQTGRTLKDLALQAIHEFVERNK